MSTTTDISTLVINYLTEAQYAAAKTAGTLNENQLYLTPAHLGLSADDAGSAVDPNPINADQLQGHTASYFQPAVTYSTTDLTAGSSSLTTGTIYLVYE